MGGTPRGFRERGAESREISLKFSRRTSKTMVRKLRLNYVLIVETRRLGRRERAESRREKKKKHLELHPQQPEASQGAEMTRLHLQHLVSKSCSPEIFPATIRAKIMG